MKVYLLIREVSVGYDGETETTVLDVCSSRAAADAIAQEYRQRAGVPADWDVEEFEVDSSTDRSRLMNEADRYAADQREQEQQREAREREDAARRARLLAGIPADLEWQAWRRQRTSSSRTSMNAMWLAPTANVITDIKEPT